MARSRQVGPCPRSVEAVLCVLSALFSLGPCEMRKLRHPVANAELLTSAKSWSGVVDGLATQDFVATRGRCPRPGLEATYNLAQHQQVMLTTVRDPVAPFGPSDKVHRAARGLEMR